jgi:coniferyl-aldehyde dehydrogenase
MFASPNEAGAVFQRLQDRFDARGGLSLEERSRALKALRTGLQRRAEAFVAAVSADFGFRSRHETLLTEIVVVSHPSTIRCRASPAGRRPARSGWGRRTGRPAPVSSRSRAASPA